MENHLYKHLNQNIFQKILNKFSLLQVNGTKKGIYLERNVKFLRYKKKIFLGDNLIIKEGSRFCCTNPDAMMSIGNNTSIGYNTFIFSSYKILLIIRCSIIVIIIQVICQKTVFDHYMYPY